MGGDVKQLMGRGKERTNPSPDPTKTIKLKRRGPVKYPRQRGGGRVEFGQVLTNTIIWNKKRKTTNIWM